MSKVHDSHLEHILFLYDFADSVAKPVAKAATREEVYASLLNKNIKPSVLHAVTMAQKLNAKLIVLNIRDAFSEEKIGKDDYVHQATKMIQKELFGYVASHGVKAEIIVKEGKHEAVLKQVVDEKHISIVVLSTEPIKGRNAIFSASNSLKLSTMLGIPVFNVKSEFTQYSYRKILVPLDESLNEREKVLYARMLGEVYKGGEVIVLGVDTTSIATEKAKFRAILSQVDDYLSKAVDRVRVIIEPAKNKMQTLLDVIEKERPDIVLVMTDGSNYSFKAAFKDVTEKANLPVIIVPPKMELKTGRVGV